jgi:hypothetical protein
MNIQAARNVPIETVVQACGLRLRRQGRELVGGCPRCGGRDRFAVHTGKQVWHCRGCDAGGGVIDLLMHVAACDFRTAVARLNGTTSWPRAVASAAPSPTAAPKEDTRNITEAMLFWNEAVHTKGTPVIPYLDRRNAPLPSEAAGAAIRFHRACRFGSHRVPCMVALVRNILTNAPQAIHRTAIDLKGNKIEVDGRYRMALGPTAGGAVKLIPDDMVTNCMGIGEGIESTLSMRLALEFGESPVWSVLSDGGVKHFPAGVECLWIGVDNDANEIGQRAATKCSDRWREAGRDVFRIASKRRGEDLNDLAQRASCAPP